MKILFNSPSARRFLLEHGYVYTVRHGRQTPLSLTNNPNLITTVDVYEHKNLLGNGKKFWVRNFHGDDIITLEPYVEASGFDTAERWITEIEALSGDNYASELWALYLVVLENHQA